MAVKVTWLSQGDVVQADNSWRVDGPVKGDLKKLWVNQKVRQVEDKSSPQELFEEDGGRRVYYPTEYFVDDTGPTVTEKVQLKVGNGYMKLADVLAQEGISVHGKSFVVVKTQPDHEDHPFNQLVTAQELTADNKIKPNGVAIVFNQSAEFIGSPYHVHQLKVVGRMEPTFAPFKPV